MIGYLLMKVLSDRARLILGCCVFDLSIIGCALTLYFTSEPPWILALSWGAMTLTAADIIYSVIIIERQEVAEINN